MHERGEKKIKAVFKRFETDEEYRARMIASGVDSWRVYAKKGAELDAVGDARNPMIQRRIVEDVTT